MFNTTRRSKEYFESCTAVVKSYIGYLTSNDIVVDLCSNDGRFTEDIAGLYCTVLHDYNVSVDVLRHAVSVSLGLESDLNFFQWKDLAFVCARRLERELSFAESFSRSKKQGVLQCCMHIMYTLRNIALEEVQS